jgi:dTDP-4-dehydrorhamnose reductase
MARPRRRVLLLGGSGRLGRVLTATWRDRHDLLLPGRAQLDLAHPDRLATALAAFDFDTLVNVAGLTSPDTCEDNPDLAWRVNAESPGRLGQLCAEHGARLIHLSTDYVFAGDGSEPLDEEAPTVPVNVYGRSKRAGEQAVLSACPAALVGRVSWLFGDAGGDVPTAVLERVRRGAALDFIEDKWSAPTWTHELADWLETLITDSRDLTGLLHLCHSGSASWRDFAQAVLDLGHELGLLSEALSTQGRCLAEFSGFRATRPPWTVMDNSRLTGLLGAPPRPWREALRLHLQRMADWVSRR